MLTTAKKAKVIKKAQIHDTDTGSSNTQIAILSERIKELSDHLKKHKKDNHSRRGLIKLVAKRRNHLKFLERHDKAAFDKISKDLKLAK
jgi:small subunit ribosomal protein S15